MKKETNVRESMRRNIKAYNRFMKDDYLFSLSALTLLRLVHPIDRPDFALECKRIGLVTEAEYRTVLQPYIMHANR